MLDLIDRTLVELDREITTISAHLQNWWSALSEAQQLFFVGVVSAALLLLALRKPARRNLNSYDERNATGVMSQFLFAAVIIVVFTFGIDIALEAEGLAPFRK